MKLMGSFLSANAALVPGPKPSTDGTGGGQTGLAPPIVALGGPSTGGGGGSHTQRVPLMTLTALLSDVKAGKVGQSGTEVIDVVVRPEGRLEVNELLLAAEQANAAIALNLYLDD